MAFSPSSLSCCKYFSSLFRKRFSTPLDESSSRRSSIKPESTSNILAYSIKSFQISIWACWSFRKITSLYFLRLYHLYVILARCFSNFTYRNLCLLLHLILFIVLLCACIRILCHMGDRQVLLILFAQNSTASAAVFAAALASGILNASSTSGHSYPNPPCPAGSFCVPISSSMPHGHLYFTVTSMNGPIVSFTILFSEVTIL